MAFRFLLAVFVVVFLSLLDGRFAAPSYCQERIPTDGPCKNSNGSIFFNLKGRWIKRGDVMMGDISLPHRQEAVKRVDEFHKMIAEIYPSPTGVDAAWGRQKGTERFAEEINHVSIPVVGYYYNAGFFRYTVTLMAKTKSLPVIRVKRVPGFRYLPTAISPGDHTRVKTGRSTGGRSGAAIL